MNRNAGYWISGSKLLSGLIRTLFIAYVLWVPIPGMAQTSPVSINKLEQKFRDHPENLIFHSVFSAYIPGLNGQFRLLLGDSIRGDRFTALNLDLITLFGEAWGNGLEDFPHSQVRLMVRDTSAFLTTTSGMAYSRWAVHHAFNYELSVPPQMNDQFFRIMRHDLRRFFPQYRVDVEQDSMTSYALVRLKGWKDLHSAGGKPGYQYNGFGCQIRNGYLILLVEILRTLYLQHFPYPLINGTDYLNRVDLDIHANLTSLSSINQALASYHLRFVRRRCLVDRLVIRDIPPVRPNRNSYKLYKTHAKNKYHE